MIGVLGFVPEACVEGGTTLIGSIDPALSRGILTQKGGVCSSLTESRSTGSTDTVSSHYWTTTEEHFESAVAPDDDEEPVRQKRCSTRLHMVPVTAITALPKRESR